MNIPHPGFVVSTRASLSDPIIEIRSVGAGGAIYYIEGERQIRFAWEFAMPPAVALVFGPSARAWDHEAPWAPGRRAEIYERVGAEVVRQKASGGSFELFLDANRIQILGRGAVSTGRRGPYNSMRTVSGRSGVEAGTGRGDHTSSR